jgi:hypothetical protein
MYKNIGWEQFNMEKYFIPLVIAVFILSTATVTAIGQDYIKKHQGETICVESRSCAINYMNNIDKEQE